MLPLTNEDDMLHCNMCCFLCFSFYSMVKLCFALAIGLTYMLQFYVPFGIIWPKISRKISDENHKFYGEYVCRALMVIGTCEYYEKFICKKFCRFYTSLDKLLQKHSQEIMQVCTKHQIITKICLINSD